MAGNILSFTLGLASSSFLQNIGRANSSLTSLLGTAAKLSGVGALVGGAFEGLRQSANIVQGVFSAIERGGNLQQLHQRTDQSVYDLFRMQRGFQAVGLDADSLGRMIFHLQKSMTGINDVGEDTGVVFSVLGLNMMQLRNLPVTEQFQKIAAALKGVNAAQAAGLSGKLFGREGAADFLQLARSSDEFTDALNKNAAAAAIVARNAAAWQKIEVTIQSLKYKFMDFFSGVAQGVAPAIQKIADWLNKIDLTSIGKKFGDVLGTLAQIIEDRNLGQLLSLSFQAGLEEFRNYFQATVAGMEAMLVQMWKNAEQHSANVAQAVGQAALKFSFFPPAALAAGISAGAGAAKVGQNSGDNAGLAFRKAFSTALAQGDNSAVEALKKFVAREFKKFETTLPPEGGGKTGSAASQTLGGPVKTDFTSVEKMGFVFGAGGPSILSDHARQTAQNTARIAQNTQTLITIFKPQNAAGAVSLWASLGMNQIF